MQANSRAADTNEGVFLTSEAEFDKQIANLLVHVRKGCLSDDVDVPVVIRAANGKTRKIRGTSQLEQLHSRYVELKAGTQMGPEVAHALLQQFSLENNVSFELVFD